MRSVSREGYTALIKALKNIELEVFGDTQESVMSTSRLSAAARYLRMPIRLEAVSKPDCRYFNGREFAFV